MEGDTMNKLKLKKLAYSISELLDSEESSLDVCIYFNDHRLSYEFNKNSEVYEWVLQEGLKGSNYTQYANDETITMTFEGDFYSCMNYGSNPILYEKFGELLKKYDLYFELGNAWNLALYKT